MRDSAQTQLFQQGIMLPQPDFDPLDNIRPLYDSKSSEDSSNSDKSEDETMSDHSHSPQ
jgi:hypothetical protein